MKQLSSFEFNSTIVLNGSSLKGIHIDSSKKIIAVDGAFNMLHDLGITADYITGDFDSINVSDVSAKHKNKLHHNSDQDTTDFEKAIMFARNMQLTPSMILGINGKEIDHTINNIHVMVKHHKYDGELFFLDLQNDGKAKLGITLTTDRKFSCGVGATVSIFPFPSAVITTHGLQYPILKQKIVQSEGVLCARNRSISEEIEILVHEGLILITMDCFYTVSL